MRVTFILLYLEKQIVWFTTFICCDRTSPSIVFSERTSPSINPIQQKVALHCPRHDVALHRPGRQDTPSIVPSNRTSPFSAIFYRRRPPSPLHQDAALLYLQQEVVLLHPSNWTPHNFVPPCGPSPSYAPTTGRRPPLPLQQEVTILHPSNRTSPSFTPPTSRCPPLPLQQDVAIRPFDAVIQSLHRLCLPPRGSRVPKARRPRLVAMHHLQIYTNKATRLHDAPQQRPARG